MVSYCTEAELEAHLMFAITATSTPTTTQVGSLITYASELIDGLTSQTGGFYEADPDEEDVKAACIVYCAAVIKNKWNGNEAIDALKKLKDILKVRAVDGRGESISFRKNTQISS